MMKKGLAIIIILIIGYWGFRSLEKKYSSFENNFQRLELETKSKIEVDANSPKNETTTRSLPEANNETVSQEPKAISTPAEPMYRRNESPRYPSNTYVSCQTARRYCMIDQSSEPYDPEQSTYCITFAGSCESEASIQRVWSEEEFREQELAAQNLREDEINASENIPNPNLQIPGTVQDPVTGEYIPKPEINPEDFAEFGNQPIPVSPNTQLGQPVSPNQNLNGEVGIGIHPDGTQIQPQQMGDEYQ